MIMMNGFLMFDTFQCHFKPPRLCKIGVNTKPTHQIILHLTFRSVPVLPGLFEINTKNANFFPKMVWIALLHIGGFKE